MGCFLFAAEANAQPVEDEAAAEIQTLERQIESEFADLATGDCTVACLALESMLRATERLCELAPGPKCEDARNKVADAKRRVSESCPDCEASHEEQAVTPVPPTPAEPASMGDDDETADAAGPPAEEARGGCAACAIGRRPDAPGALLAGLLALGLTLWRRRRR
ncbi:MAG: hypothetical protein JRI68_03695 [Deltaproteobacteria bacterium]|nr:hypothetical protein [Deltaproteobacteria bacterium]